MYSQGVMPSSCVNGIRDKQMETLLSLAISRQRAANFVSWEPAYKAVKINEKCE